MKTLFVYAIVLLCMLSACSKNTSSKKERKELLIKVDKGEINLLENGDCVIKLNDKITQLKDIKTFIVFNNAPYFELNDGRILRWDVSFADHALNLQKIWDELYFIKQYGTGASLEETTLNRIEKNGKIYEINLKQKGESFITENYGVFNGKYIILEDSDRGFCIASKKGSVIQCYPWPE